MRGRNIPNPSHLLPIKINVRRDNDFASGSSRCDTVCGGRKARMKEWDEFGLRWLIFQQFIWAAGQIGGWLTAVARIMS